jgi:hypothetical protein
MMIEPNGFVKPGMNIMPPETMEVKIFVVKNYSMAVVHSFKVIYGSFL